MKNNGKNKRTSTPPTSFRFAPIDRERLNRLRDRTRWKAVTVISEALKLLEEKLGRRTQ